MEKREVERIVRNYIENFCQTDRFFLETIQKTCKEYLEKEYSWLEDISETLDDIEEKMNELHDLGRQYEDEIHDIIIEDIKGFIDYEDLEGIAEEVRSIDRNLNTIETKLSNLEDDLSELKERIDNS